MSARSEENRISTREAGRVLLIATAIGALCGLATWAFILADHWGVKLLWDVLPSLVPGVPAQVVSVATVVVMTLLAAAVVALVGHRPFDSGAAEVEYANERRMDYRHVLSGALFSLLSLFSGAAVGPEAPLTDINGGLGTFIAERMRLKPDLVKILAYSGVAGAFGAFFGAAPVGALLAAELLDSKALMLDRTALVAGLAAGASGWVVYATLGGERVPVVLTFPGVTEPSLSQLIVALVLGLLGGLLGVAYGAAFMRTRAALEPLRRRPWIAALVGGATIALAAVFTPYLLFSGQQQVGGLIQNAATFGALFLLGLGIGKLLLSIWSLSTAYFGGPIFPLIFAGTCFGLALHAVVPTIPEGVAVLAIIASMVTTTASAPLSVTVFLALMSEQQLVSIIAIGAVAGFIVRQLVAPTVPSIYWSAQSDEAAQNARQLADV